MKFNMYGGKMLIELYALAQDLYRPLNRQKIYITHFDQSKQCSVKWKLLYLIHYC